ncbi:MAG: hypothetical protein QM756_21280 [Polyangiaceae bacterium]
MLSPGFARIFGLFLLLSGCFSSHTAYVQGAALPPPPEPMVRHSTPLWVNLVPGVSPTTCVEPASARKLCFAELDTALGTALERSLWPSFPRVVPLGRRDEPAPGDYVLTLELNLDALPPSSDGPGWAALGRGNWRLTRDGVALAGEDVESRSRAEFAYGRALGNGASEVVDAIALHIAMALGALPETRPDRPTPLPPVLAKARTAPRVVAQTASK